MTNRIEAFTEAKEQAFLAVLTQELNTEFGLQLGTAPSTDRLLRNFEVGSTKNTLIILGGSHTSRLADKLSSLAQEVIDLSISGLTVTNRSIADITSELEATLEDLDLRRSQSF